MSFEIVYNKALKIYSKLYVGCKPQGDNKVPLGFVTPYEDTAAGRKRQETVKTWVGNKEYIWDPATRKQTVREFTPDLRLIENVPRAGFKITDDVKRVYWGGGNVVWRLEDPLGWEIEIQSSNLMAIIQHCGISAGGEIQGECVIGRDGAHNILLPVSSQEFIDAVKAAESAKKPSKIPMKDRVIGRTYRLLDGSFGVYLGRHEVSSEAPNERKLQSYGLNFKVPNRSEFFAIETDISSNILSAKTEQFEAVYVDEVTMYPGESYSYKKSRQTKYYKSAPLISELDQNSFDIEKGLELANSSEMSWASSSRHDKPCFASLTKDIQLKYSTRKISEKKFQELRDKVVLDAKKKQENYEQQLKYWNENKIGSVPQKPTFTIAEMFSTWGNGAILKSDNGKLYDLAREIYIGTAFRHANIMQSDSRSFQVLGLMRLDGAECFYIHPKTYNALTRVVPSGNSIDMDLKTLTLETFESIDAVLMILNEQHSKNRIVEKFITNMEA